MSVPSREINHIVNYLMKEEKPGDGLVRDADTLDLGDGLFNDEWPSNSDELLENFFSMDGGLLDLPTSHDDLNPLSFVGDQGSITACSLAGSDSGLSMDHPDLDLLAEQQMSPLMMHNSDDDILSSSLNTNHVSLDSISSLSPESSSSPGQSSPSISDVGSPADCYEDKMDLSTCQNTRETPQPAQTFQNLPNLKRKSSSPPPAAVVYPKIQKQFINRRDSQPIKNITLPRIDKQRIILNQNGSSNIQIVNNQSLNGDIPMSQKKIIRVAPVVGNPRSILLPVTLKDMKDIRSIKIINATDLKNPANIKLAAANFLQKSKQAMDNRKKNNNVMYAAFDSDEQQYIMEDSMSDRGSGHSDDDDDDRMGDDVHVNHKNGHFPRLELTSEERRLLVKEGISLPSSYPLTRLEERELKRIRRKIRNKISAQDSRRRKKEYVDGLEDRVKQCSDENQSLMRKLKVLQSQNQSLSSQLKKLQNIVTKGSGGYKSTQPATCLMVLLLSVALVMAPSLRAGNGPSQTRAGNSLSSLHAPHSALLNSIRRALLSAHTVTPPTSNGVVPMDESAEDVINVDEMVYGQPLNDHNYPLLECPIPAKGGRYTTPRYMDIPIDEGGMSPKRGMMMSPMHTPVKLEKLEYDSEYDGNELFLSHHDEVEEVIIDSKDFKEEGIKLYDMAMEKVEILEDRSAFAHISGKLNEILDLSPPALRINPSQYLQTGNNKNHTRKIVMTNMELQ